MPSETTYKDSDIPQWFFRQSGALPFRRQNGSLEILLITSRSGKRWIIPKGIVDPGLTPEESACQEAYEEAGVRGVLHATLIGTYEVSKWGGACTVSVFPLLVTEIIDDYPESDIRNRRWVPIHEAESLVSDDLRRIIKRLPRIIGDI